MSNAAEVHLTIDKGADFAMQLYWTDFNSTPFTVVSPMRMEIRDATGTVAATLQTDDDAPDALFDTILYNSDSGLIQLMISKGVTNTMTPGMYRYDLFVTYVDNLSVSSTRLTKLMYGTVLVTERVTQNV